MSGRLLDWHVASRPSAGETVCGDRAVVAATGSGALAAAVDGLGHGPEAAYAAERAIAALRDAGAEDVVAVTHRCHAALADTRGAAIGVARFDAPARTLAWAAVGNVEGRLVRPGTRRPEALNIDPGVVGHTLPSIHANVLPVERGDMLIVATDGLDAHFADDLRTSGSCADIAEALLAQHGRVIDDALVLVIRYLGSPEP